MLGERGVAFHHLVPQFDGIAHSIDGTGELEQEPSPVVLTIRRDAPGSSRPPPRV
jgi:hypothetical protein